MWLILVISPLFLTSKKCASYFCRETIDEIKQFKRTKSWTSNNLIHIWSDKAFKGNDVIAVLLLLHEGVIWNLAYSPNLIRSSIQNFLDSIGQCIDWLDNALIAFSLLNKKLFNNSLSPIENVPLWISF